MHDIITVGIPLIAILAGILFNRSDGRDLRSEMKDLRSEMNAKHSEVMSRFTQIDGDLRQFYHLTGKLEARMDSLEKQR